MTRMGREFTLVLLGAGVLTAGYFAAPTPAEELEKKAEEQAAARTGHATHYRSRGHLIFVHSPGYAGGYGGRPAALGAVSRGGFGGVGRSFGGGGSA